MKKFLGLVISVINFSAYSDVLPYSPDNIKLNNANGYKLRFVTDLSSIKPVDDWYPSFYEKSTNGDGVSVNDTSNRSIEVNNGFIYRLVGFMKYNKYSNSFQRDLSQLRLCQIKVDGSSNWDCSIIIANDSSGLYSSRSAEQYLIPSSNGNNIIIYYNNGKNSILAEYSSFTNFVATIDIPKDILNTFRSYLPKSYYDSQKLYTSIGVVNFKNSTVSLINDSVTFSLDNKCYYPQSKAFPIYNRYYTINQDRLFNVEFIYKSGFVIESQIGEANADLDNSIKSATINKYVAARSANELLILSNNVVNKNNNASRALYVISDNSDSKQQWKTLTVSESFLKAKKRISKGAEGKFDVNGMYLFSSDENAFMSIPVGSDNSNSGSANNQGNRQYLYEVLSKN